jgi:hypothetical protein
VKNALLAILGSALAGGAVFFATRRRATLNADQLADFLTGNDQLPDAATAWAHDIAEAALRTAPSDYFPELDGDAAVKRWALLLVAIGDHESHFGTGAGYFPKSDPTGYGDKGNAFGFWQIDRHYHWDFIKSDAAQSVFGQALYIASRILAPNWRRFAFVADQSARERLAVISYNASAARIAAMIASGASVDAADATTTKMADGTPYGTDVLSRVERMS